MRLPEVTFVKRKANQLHGKTLGTVDKKKVANKITWHCRKFSITRILVSIEGRQQSRANKRHMNCAVGQLRLLVFGAQLSVSIDAVFQGDVFLG